MGHTGVQLRQYNSTVSPRPKITPGKAASTFYYQSDGTGRDSYVLKHNGGLRFEYSCKQNGDRVFKDSLRSDMKS